MRCEAHPGVMWGVVAAPCESTGPRALRFPVILGALGVFGCGGDRPGGTPPQGGSKDTAAAVTFPLNDENRSGRHGEASLQPGEKSLQGQAVPAVRGRECRSGSPRTPARATQPISTT
jgi:hypothetical protein